MVARRSAPGRRGRRKSTRRARRPKAAGAGIRYMESSALVAALLEHDTAAMKPQPVGTQYVTSALTLAEAGRAILRARATCQGSAAAAQACMRAPRTIRRRVILRYLCPELIPLVI